MRIRKNVNVAIAALAVAALALTGCSQSTNSGGDAPEKTDQVLVIGVESEIPNLDPHSLTGTAGLRVSDAIYETLLREDLATPTSSAPEVLPMLGSEWEVSDDGLVYTFTIREGVTFHDGTPLDAEAVAANYARLLDEASPLYSETAAAGMSFVTRYIASTEVKDDEFLITLKSQFAEFPRLLTDRRAAIISPVALEEYGDEIGSHPTGTGPFTIETVTVGERLSLNRNENYWRGAPPLAGLIFATILDPTTMVSALETGQVDAILSAGSEQVTRIEGNDQFVVQYPDPANMYYLRLNTRAAETQDKLIRQALNYAVDREAIVAIASGQVIPANGPIPAGNAAWDESFTSPYGYDPEKAESLLAEAGVSSLSLDVIAPSSGIGLGNAREIMSLLQQNFGDIGVELNVEYMELTAQIALESPGYADDVNGSLNGWTTGADSAFFLERMFGPDQIPPQGVNRGWYVNEDLIEIFEKGRTTIDENERGAVYRDAAQIIADDAPWVFLYQNRLPRVLSGAVGGIVEVPSMYIDFATVTKQG